MREYSAMARSHLMLRGVQDYGAERCLDIVFLHGYLDNCHSFLRLLPYLRQYNLYAIDLPGHGQSDYKRGNPPDYSFSALAADIASFLERSFDKPLVLVGHSFGAILCTTLAAKHTELVAKQVLFDSVAPPVGKASVLFERLKRAARSGRGVALRFASREEAIEARVRQGTPFQAVLDLATRSLVGDGGSYYWRFDPCLLDPSGTKQPNQRVVSDISRISTPTLWLESSPASFNIKYRDKSRHLRSFEQLQTCSIGGSHHFHAEHPQQVAKRIRSFIDASCTPEGD